MMVVVFPYSHCDAFTLVAVSGASPKNCAFRVSSALYYLSKSCLCAWCSPQFELNTPLIWNTNQKVKALYVWDTGYPVASIAMSISRHSLNRGTTCNCGIRIILCSVTCTTNCHADDFLLPTDWRLVFEVNFTYEDPVWLFHCVLWKHLAVAMFSTLKSRWWVSGVGGVGVSSALTVGSQPPAWISFVVFYGLNKQEILLFPSITFPISWIGFTICHPSQRGWTTSRLEY